MLVRFSSKGNGLDILMGYSGRVHKPLNFTKLLEPKGDKAWRKIIALIHITNQLAQDLHKIIMDTKKTETTKEMARCSLDVQMVNGTSNTHTCWCFAVTLMKEEKLALAIPSKHAWKQIPNDIKHTNGNPIKKFQEIQGNLDHGSP